MKEEIEYYNLACKLESGEKTKILEQALTRP